MSECVSEIQWSRCGVDITETCVVDVDVAVTVLTLNRCYITLAGVDVALRQVFLSHPITKLHVVECMWDQSAIELFLSILPDSLTKLRFDDSLSYHVSWEYMQRAFARCPLLKELHLNAFEIRDEDAQSFATSLVSHPSLDTLYFDHICHKVLQTLLTCMVARGHHCLSLTIIVKSQRFNLMLREFIENDTHLQKLRIYNVRGGRIPLLLDHLISSLRENTSMRSLSVSPVMMSRRLSNSQAWDRFFRHHHTLHHVNCGGVCMADWMKNENVFLQGSSTYDEMKGKRMQSIDYLWDSGLLSMLDVFQVFPEETSPFANVWQYMYGDGAATVDFRKLLTDRVRQKIIV